MVLVDLHRESHILNSCGSLHLAIKPNATYKILWSQCHSTLTDAVWFYNGLLRRDVPGRTDAAPTSDVRAPTMLRGITGYMELESAELEKVAVVAYQSC